MILAISPTALFSQLHGHDPTPTQRRLLLARGKHRWMRASRQSGKTSTMLTVAADLLLHEPGSLQVLLCPAQHQSKEWVRRLTRLLADAPVADAGVFALEMANGARLVAVVGTETTSRGWASVDQLLVDEAAYVPDAVFDAFSPMLAATGGTVFAASTPAPARNWFSKVQRDPAWVGAVTDASAVPWFSAAFLDAERRRMGSARYALEYLAEEDAITGGVFTPDAIARVFAHYDDATPTLPPAPTPADEVMRYAVVPRWR